MPLNDVPGGNPLRYYLGPAYQPLNALAQFGASLLPGADMVDMTENSRRLMDYHGPMETLGDAGWLGLSALGMALPGRPGALRKAYHATWEPFDEFDWNRLGSNTLENQASDPDWSMNLAKIGPWASADDLAATIGAPVSLPIDVGGKGKRFASLNALENAVRKAGGPDAFRQKMVDAGFGHLSVNDEEFGGLSYIGLSPETFRVSRASQ